MDGSAHWLQPSEPVKRASHPSSADRRPCANGNANGRPDSNALAVATARPSSSPVQHSGRNSRLAGSGQRFAPTSARAASREPRTPRHTIAGDGRIGAVLTELQRQADVERRAMMRQIELLERRHEQLASTAGPSGRERFAEVQGSVSGLLEEVASLNRRLEAQDERIRSRVATAEEMVRQRARELEQQLNGHNQRVALALATTDEVAKRHSTTLKKLGQMVDDISRKVTPVDGIAAAEIQARLEPRLADLEARQTGLEDEIGTLSMSTAGSPPQTRPALALFGAGEDAIDADSAAQSIADSALRALDREMQRVSESVDEHSAALASLRVRSEGQEQRLAATSERIESAFIAPVEALRSEIFQLRDHDRQELDNRLDHMVRRLQTVVDASEDAATEMRALAQRACDSRLSGNSGELNRNGADCDALRRLLETSVGHEQSIRRLEAAFRDVNRNAAGASVNSGYSAEEDEFMLRDIVTRVECLEKNSAACLTAMSSTGNSDKADRSDLVRLEVSIKEITEPLQRLAKRIAGNETRSTMIERDVERLLAAIGSNKEELNARGTHDVASTVSSGKLQETDREVAKLSVEIGKIKTFYDEALRDIELQAQKALALASTADATSKSMQRDVTSVAGRRDQTVEINSAPAVIAKNDGIDKELKALAVEIVNIKDCYDAALRDVQAQAETAITLARSVEKASKDVQRDVNQVSSRLEETVVKQNQAHVTPIAFSAVVQKTEESEKELTAISAQIVHIKTCCDEAVRSACKQAETEKELAALSAQAVNIKTCCEEAVRGAVKQAEASLARAISAEESSRSAQRDVTSIETKLEESIRKHEKQVTPASAVKQAGTEKELAALSAQVVNIKTCCEEAVRGAVKQAEASLARAISAEESSRSAQRDVTSIETKLEESIRKHEKQVTPASAVVAARDDKTELELTNLSSEILKVKTSCDEAVCGAMTQAGTALVLARAFDETSKGLQRNVELVSDKVNEAILKYDLQLAQHDEDIREAAESNKRRSAMLAESLKQVDSGEASSVAMCEKIEKELNQLSVAAAAVPPLSPEESLDDIQADQTQRVAKIEKSNADLHRDSRNNFTGIDERLNKLRTDRQVPSDAALAVVHVKLEELGNTVRGVVDRVEASETATAAVREELMTGCHHSFSTVELESKLLQLSGEISEEVDALRVQRSELGKLREVAMSGRCVKVGKKVEDLAKRVEAELRDLQDRQDSLRGVRPSKLDPLKADM